VGVSERGQPGDVLVLDRIAAVAELGDGGVQVAGVPQGDGVDDDAQRAELVFLSFAVGLVDLSPLAVEDLAGQAVPGFLIIRVVISIANRSNASSMATASRCRVTAKSVAVRRGSASAANVGALLDNPYRANAAILFAGTAEQSTRRTPRPLSWDTRSNAATNERPEIRVGARRHDSNSDNGARAAPPTRREAGRPTSDPPRR